MKQQVWYLVHKDTGRRLRYYKSLPGARIAQRLRNHRLGFIQRVERVEIWDNWEVERCENKRGEILEATWCIVEDTLDIEDLYAEE